MSEDLYHWPRFWYSSGEPIGSDEGFLYNPTSEFAKYVNPHVRPFSEISQTPCLALLGEPGIGKTRAVKEEVEALEEKGEHVALFPLGRFGSEERLVKKVFESQRFREWNASEHVLHLFLDSLDEGRLSVGILHKVIIDELTERVAEKQRERLRLRITCRTAEWPPSMGAELASLWGPEGFAVYQLAQLREIDAREAAIQEGIDPDQFLREVHDREVAAFAARPITLKMLLSVYRVNRSLPKRKVEIYEQGCELLCGEQNLDRQERGSTGILSTRQRLIIASRLAAATVFANRRALRIHAIQGSRADGEIGLGEVTGGQELLNGEKLPVEEREARETLKLSGLFTRAGDGLVAWAHQTYAEFLAARYLVKRGMPVDKIMGLITHPRDPERRLAPQLHETAAWLASMDVAVFKRVLESDPEVLLRSDVGTLDAENRERLVASLLKRTEEGKLEIGGWDVERYYGKLDHPGLLDQLRPFLENRDKTEAARELALKIATRCRCSAFEEIAAAIALDAGEKEDIRALSLVMLHELPSGQAREGLRSLVVGADASDVSHRIKALALQALWPGHLSSEELFAIMGQAQEERDLENYKSFLYSDPAQHLSGADIIPALQWLRAMPSVAFRENLVRGILAVAWRTLDAPDIDVAPALAEVVFSLTQSHVHFTGEHVLESYGSETEKRRRFLDVFLSLIEVGGAENAWVVHYPWLLVLPDDTPWLLARLDRAEEEPARELLAALAARSFDMSDESQLIAVHEARRRHSALDAALEWRLGPVVLESDTARHMKIDFEARQEQRRSEEERRQQQARRRPPAELIEESLQRIESGAPEEWWRLNLWLLRHGDGESSGDEFGGDLARSPGWMAADMRNRARILQAAKGWILLVDPRTEEWVELPENRWDHRPAATYRAFRLLWAEDPDFLRGLQCELWLKWVPAILYFLRRSGSDERDARRALLQQCYQHAPDVTFDYLIQMADSILEENGRTNLVDDLEPLLDARIGLALWSRLERAGPSLEAGDGILRLLLRASYAPARAYVDALLQRPLPTEVDARRVVSVAARALVMTAKDCGWPVVWPACQEDLELGQELWLALAEEMAYSGRSHLLEMGLSTLGELYILLVRLFPPSSDPKLEGELGARREVVFLRGRILSFIAQQGTKEACEILGQIILTAPDGERLRRYLFEAQENLRRKTYVWASPQEVIMFVAQASARLVRTERELLDVVIESLGRLEIELRGHTPAVIDIWNKVTKNKYRPKDENEVSDYVKRFLDRDLKASGILFHREVEVRRRIGKGGEPGERLDVLVSFRTPEVDETLAVVIEVKGAWHKELLTAMETQLIDRYLADSQCRCGLYLVGWFNCPQWDRRDSRYRVAQKFDREQLRQALTEQAAKLSAEKDADVRAFLLKAALR
jgi:hypothetical protein